MEKTQPRSHEFRYRTANYYAVQSLESLVIRGLIASWFYAPEENRFGVHTHATDGGRPLMLTGKEVGTFETGAIAVINAISTQGLTVGEILKGVAGLKRGE